MNILTKLAVLSMLAVTLVAFNMPASALVGAGVGTRVGTAAGIASASSFTATGAGLGIGGIGLGGIGTFGGFGFPFNWGFGQFGYGGFPFNWGLGAGLGPLGLGWNHFSPCFGCGNFFSPCFLGSTCQVLPFIYGREGGCAGPGFGITPWAFGLGGCVRSMPLFFGAHGFGFPFSLGNFGLSLPPTMCLGPAAAPCGLGVGAPCGLGAGVIGAGVGAPITAGISGAALSAPARAASPPAEFATGLSIAGRPASPPATFAV